MRPDSVRPSDYRSNVTDTDLLDPFRNTEDEGFDRFLAAMASTAEPEDDAPSGQDERPEDSWGWEGDPTNCESCGTSYSQIDVFRRADGLYDVQWSAGCYGARQDSGVSASQVREILHSWRDVAGQWVEETLVEIAKLEFDA